MRQKTAFTLPITALSRHSRPPQTTRRAPSQRLQFALRLHLHRLRATLETPPPTNPSTPTPKPRQYTPEERARRSERLRARWANPEWRAAMLAKRRSPETKKRLSHSAKQLWEDPSYRSRMHAARLGRVAPNKGISPSPATRLRMSQTRRGRSVSDETRSKMSQAKLKRPEGDSWRRLISESKRGKTKEYFQMRREFRALHRDLKLWSDSYRSTFGKLPDASTYDRFVAPMMVFRIKRYLVLRDTIGEDEPDLERDIISRK